MNTLIKNIETFVALVPTAEGTEWAAIETYVEMAEVALIDSLWGEALHTALEALHDDDIYKHTAQKMLAFTAYHTAIPFVDLVATPNGFAVVSNANQAPASKERVERLLQWCVLCIDGLTDVFIRRITTNSVLHTAWKAFKDYNSFVDALFISGIDFCYAIGSKQTLKRAEFEKWKPDLLIWQNTVLAPVVSANYLAELITRQQDNTLTTADNNALHYCRLVLVALVKKNEIQHAVLLQSLGNLLDSNTTDYPTYASSSEYALKHAPRKGNEADHSTYFWGL